MTTPVVQFGLFNIGGAELVLLLVLLGFLALIAAGFITAIYLVVRAAKNRTASAPPTLPPETMFQEQRQRDLEHLKLLSIFHFVFAGLAFLGIAFLGVHYAMMHKMFSNPELWKTPGPGIPPKEFLHAFVWFYVFFGIVMLAALVVNTVSGVFLWHRTNRIFSLIIAGLDCVQIPFGTALGVFTILVLSRPSVPKLYSGEPR